MTVAAELPQARVASFVADVTLTPKLSVGTVTPDSIYEARFVGKIAAARSNAELPDGKTAGDCEIELPLPPQIISLADLSIVTPDGPREQVTLRDGKLVWRGELRRGGDDARRELHGRREGVVRVVGGARRDWWTSIRFR